MSEITVTLDACQPDELLSDPSGVFVRMVGWRGHGAEVELRGEPEDVFRFVQVNWGDEEADIHRLRYFADQGDVKAAAAYFVGRLLES